jgi:hypothetical protein
LPRGWRPTATTFGSKQPHRRARGLLRAHRRSLEPRLGLRDRQRHVEDAAVQTPADLVARVEEDVHHAAVLAEHVRVEGPDAVIARDLRQPLEQPRPDAAPLQRVGNREGHLRAIGRLHHPRVAGHRHDAAAQIADKGNRRGSSIRSIRSSSPSSRHGEEATK